MNEIKISGKVIKKDVFDNELFTRFILEIPTKMKVINDNKIERVNNYISFILFTPCINDFPEINKNTYIEIRGEILGNSNKNEEIMPHQTRTPSTQLSLCKDLFNQLVGILDFNIKMNIEDEKFSTTAEKLKNKLLTYSVPRVNNDDVEFVDVRFFPNEASDMIWQLLLRAEKNDNVEDYYSKLIENREQKK